MVDLRKQFSLLAGADMGNTNAWGEQALCSERRYWESPQTDRLLNFKTHCLAEALEVLSLVSMQ